MNDASKQDAPEKTSRVRKTIHLGWNKPGQPPRQDGEGAPEDVGAGEAPQSPPSV